MTGHDFDCGLLHFSAADVVQLFSRAAQFNWPVTQELFLRETQEEKYSDRPGWACNVISKTIRTPSGTKKKIKTRAFPNLLLSLFTKEQKRTRDVDQKKKHSTIDRFCRLAN